MSLRAKYSEAKPLTGARIARSLHMTIQTAVLIETLTALGAQVRWASAASSPPRTARPPIAAGVPVFAEGRDARGVLGLHRRRPVAERTARSAVRT
jgi:adenosylhomocysteinase